MRLFQPQFSQRRQSSPATVAPTTRLDAARFNTERDAARGLAARGWAARRLAAGRFTPRGLATRGRRARRRGVSIYLFVLAFPMMIGLLGIVIDLGNLYSKRAQAQRAADAAAIAGAMEFGVEGGDVVGQAKNYASRNGYTDGVKDATVTVTPSDNEVRVRVARKEAVYFAPILEGLLLAMGKSNEAAQFSRTVSAEGTARTKVALPLGLGGIYGIADPSKSPVNNSVFGPYSNYNFGDAYSPEFLQDGETPNPLYEKNAGVGEYKMHITADYLKQYKDVALQIYDPDCYDGPNGYDEIRDANSKIKPGKKKSNVRETTTVYEIYDPNGNLVASQSYGADKNADGKWVTPNGFNFTPAAAGDYTVKVSTTEGSSENGFQLRAGPSEGAAKSDDQWNADYGDKNGAAPNNVAVPIEADDHLQINFTQTGTVKFRLGYVPPTQAGKTISVSKFDVDVGSRNITYTCDTLPGQSFNGVLPNPGDGVWSTDDIPLPSNYTGGNWYAQYSAAKDDSSTWTLSGAGNGEHEVRLVK